MGSHGGCKVRSPFPMGKGPGLFDPRQDSIRLIGEFRMTPFKVNGTVNDHDLLGSSPVGQFGRILEHLVVVVVGYRGIHKM